ncbi:hypothetical protein BJ170DRAFT_687672 [Xylariales sp. AK1849]|nr:hypothetical protein BJ170DRAFT_687672 [Xylariales sp. AK1849]
MPSMLRLSVFGCAIALTNAKWFRRGDETPSWEPAKETDRIAELDPAVWTPKPTPAPGANLVEMELRKRAGTSTCAYYAGYSSSAAIVCLNQASCVVQDSDRAIGCCNSANIQNCKVPTTCVESSHATSYAGLNLDFTVLCTESAYPYCVTYSYDTYDPLFAGYSAFGCGDVWGVYSVEYYAPALGSASLSSSSRTSPVSSRTTSSTGPSSTSSSRSSTTTSSTTSSTTPSTATPISQPTSQTQTTPIGAIVGGVVGGIGGIALIVAGILLCLRHSKKNKGTPPPQAPPTQTTNLYSPGPDGPGSGAPLYGQTPPPMGQVPQQFAGYPPAGFAAVDNRTSTAPSSYFPQSPKSQYDSVTTVPISPSVSPPLQDHAYPSPPAGQQLQYPTYNTSPAQHYQPHNPQQHSRAMELPTSAPDRELRELA